MRGLRMSSTTRCAKPQHSFSSSLRPPLPPPFSLRVVYEGGWLTSCDARTDRDVLDDVDTAQGFGQQARPHGVGVEQDRHLQAVGYHYRVHPCPVLRFEASVLRGSRALFAVHVALGGGLELLEHPKSEALDVGRLAFK